MIIRVLDALEASGMVKTIVVCGPPAAIIPDCPELEDRIRSGRVDLAAESGFAQPERQ